MINDLKISLASLDDLNNVFNLSNDLVVRQNSFNSDLIPFDSHVLWFKQKINDKNSIFFVIKTKTNDFVGCTRFDKDFSEKKKFEYVMTIHLVEDFRGKGLGSKLIKKTSKMLFEDYDALKIYACIKHDNVISLKSFLKADYKIILETEINGYKSFKLIYEKTSE